jgi:Na+/glutamate symporter
VAVIIVLGLACGLVFGVASALTGRFLGTVLACVPLAGWFGALAVVLAGPEPDAAVQALALCLLGLLLGSFIGGAVVRRSRSESASDPRASREQ